MKNQKAPKINVCATPVGPCVSAEGSALHPVVVVLGGVATAIALVKLAKALSS